MNRTIKFRGKTASGDWIYGDLIQSYKTTAMVILPVEESNMNKYIMVDRETVGQFTGLLDKNGKEIYEGDTFKFWAIYPSTQTHSGDNIPGGSYTEPAETMFIQLTAQVCWDEDRLKWTFSLIGGHPYQFHNYFNWWETENVIPIIGREPHSLEYIKETYGYEGISDDEWKEYINDAGFETEGEMMKVVNTIDVIGNIHDNPDLI